MSTSTPDWEIKRFIHPLTAAEHQADTMANLLRRPMVLAALQSPNFTDLESGEKILQLYLNECRAGQDAAWYEETQKHFLHLHQDWVPLFGMVLATRLQSGSKSQKSNIMGDWLALSSLQGTPMPFELLAQPRNRDPRKPAFVIGPNDDIQITAAPPKEGLYRHVFEQLYSKHKDTHRGWNALLERQTLRGLTSATWDAYVEVFPNKVSSLIKGFNQNRSYEWLSMMQGLEDAKHADVLATHVVEVMQNGRAQELYSALSEDTYGSKDHFLYKAPMAHALYATLKKEPKVRSKLSTDHLVHLVNGDLKKVQPEMDYAVSTNANAHASGNLFSPPYFSVLQPATREKLLTTLVASPSKYYALATKIICSTEETSLTAKEMKTFLSSTFVQAAVMECTMEKKTWGFFKNFLALHPEVVEELNAASFNAPDVYESIVLKHMVPGLSYADAHGVRNMAASLGVDSVEARMMLKIALDGIDAQKSLSIDGLLDECSSNSSFPA